MELRQYYAILRRSWRLVVGLPLLVALLTVALWVILPARYTARTAMLVTQQPLATNAPNMILPDYNNFNSWAASEYVVDDLLQLVQTPVFASDVVERIKQKHGLQLDPKTVREGLSAERKHRTVYLMAEAIEGQHAMWIADGAVEMLQDKGLAYWGREETSTLDVAVLERPERAQRVVGVTGLALDIIIRSLLAFLLAVGLAFLRQYLDQTLQHRNDIEALGLEVIGSIPLAKGAKG